MDSCEDQSRLRVQWTHGQRRCTAIAVDAKGQPQLVVTFQSDAAVDDPIVRARLERQAIAVLQGLLEP